MTKRERAVLGPRKDAVEYAKTLATIRDTALAGTGTEENSADFIGGLNGEIAVLLTSQMQGGTVWDGFNSGTAEGVSKGTADAEETAAQVTQDLTEIQQLDSGQAV